MSHLPVELCSMIVSHFADDRQTLLSLLLVSRNFLHEACRFLYRAIYIQKDHQRDHHVHVPLSNPTERAYYASLVRSLTIDPRTVSHTSIRRLLSSTTNLEDLHFTTELTHNDVLAILRWKYPFKLKTLSIHARFHPILLAFFKSQSNIRTLAWDPIQSPAQCLPSDARLLPNVTSLKTWGSAIMDSPWFMEITNVRHLCISAARGGYVDLHRQASKGSERITSLRLHKFIQKTQVSLISTLFPNLQYLDARFMEVSFLFLSSISHY